MSSVDAVDAENLIKIAIHNFEKNEFKFFAKIPYIKWQQISTKNGVVITNSSTYILLKQTTAAEC